MSKFHINPENGEPGPCRAMVKCPFGDLEKDHYDTADDARRAYEKVQEGTPWHSVSKDGDGAGGDRPLPPNGLTKEEAVAYHDLYQEYGLVLSQEFDHSSIYSAPSMPLEAMAEEIDRLANKAGLPDSLVPRSRHFNQVFTYATTGAAQLEEEFERQYPKPSLEVRPTAEEKTYLRSRGKRLNYMAFAMRAHAANARRAEPYLGARATEAAAELELKALHYKIEEYETSELLLPRRGLFNRREVAEKLEEIQTERAAAEAALAKLS